MIDSGAVRLIWSHQRMGCIRIRSFFSVCCVLRSQNLPASSCVSQSVFFLPAHSLHIESNQRLDNPRTAHIMYVPVSVLGGNCCRDSKLNQYERCCSLNPAVLLNIVFVAGLTPRRSK